jgi:pyruvate-ferredoxin/flavodoxin oxidoreductase
VRRQFSIGIHDDLTHLSLDWDEAFRTDAANQLQHAVFWGLGADGTVSANKNSIKIVGEGTDLQAQGYFVYDSKKSGAVTVSHLRFGKAPIRSTYLVEEGMANFVACHQTVFTERYDLLAHAAPGGVFLLNTPEPADQAWASLPESMRVQIMEKRLRFWVIDAYQVAFAACRHGTAHQHHHADLLLRHLRHPAQGGRHRRDQEGGGQDLRQEEQAPGGPEPPGHRHDPGSPA